MTARVLKWTVPVDDQLHLIGEGKVLLVGNQGAYDTVVVWTLEYRAKPARRRRVLAIGTGHPLPAIEWEHIGSTLAGPLVWHLFEATP